MLAADAVQDSAASAMVKSIRSPGRGSRARSATVPALLSHPARRRDAGSFAGVFGTIEKLRQLDAQGLIVKRGTLVDAKIIAAAVKRPQRS